MENVIKKFFELEKKDKIIFFLLCGTVGNFLVAIIKFIISLNIPSFWFFINSVFSFTLGISRFSTLKKYKKIKEIENVKSRLLEEYKIYSQNGIMLIVLRHSLFFC